MGYNLKTDENDTQCDDCLRYFPRAELTCGDTAFQNCAECDDDCEDLYCEDCWT